VLRLTPLLILALPIFGCQRAQPELSGAGQGQIVLPAGPTQLEAVGLHNVFRVSDRILSGSSPEGEAGFSSLESLGVKSIISVDGAQPDIKAARRHGMRYVHLPFGYEGIPPVRIIELAKAATSLAGPIYVHCHHGKHRGPTAVAVMQLCCDPSWDTSKAEAWLKTAGTDPRYTELVRLPKSLTRPTSDALDRVNAEFPEVAKVADLPRLMVGVDSGWDNLKFAKAAGWTKPMDHPDVDPAHEALQLAERFREAARLESAKKRGPVFVNSLVEAEMAATELEGLLRTSSPVFASAEQAFARLASTCTACHVRFRDRPNP
jgi:protein tyrosine phosphatase (PTP) superfamily phosphohydrolase (DUF442 family)